MFLISAPEWVCGWESCGVANNPAWCQRTSWRLELFPKDVSRHIFFLSELQTWGARPSPSDSQLWTHVFLQIAQVGIEWAGQDIVSTEWDNLSSFTLDPEEKNFYRICMKIWIYFMRTNILISFASYICVALCLWLSPASLPWTGCLESSIVDASWLLMLF